jgi:hypothetical protein
MNAFPLGIAGQMNFKCQNERNYNDSSHRISMLSFSHMGWKSHLYVHLLKLKLKISHLPWKELQQAGTFYLKIYPWIILILKLVEIMIHTTSTTRAFQT